MDFEVRTRYWSKNWMSEKEQDIKIRMSIGVRIGHRSKNWINE